MEPLEQIGFKSICKARMLNIAASLKNYFTRFDRLETFQSGIIGNYTVKQFQ